MMVLSMRKFIIFIAAIIKFCLTSLLYINIESVNDGSRFVQTGVFLFALT